MNPDPIMNAARRGLMLLLGLVVLSGTGCSPSRFLARQLVRAPNTFPDVYSPPPRVYYGYRESLIDFFPPRQVDLEASSPPGQEAHLAVRIIPPGNYQLQIRQDSWTQKSRVRPLFQFSGTVPPAPRDPSEPVRGVVVLLHGYGLRMDTLLPWGLLFAEQGWASVLVDLRGHGLSSGPMIGFGSLESRDLSTFLDQLDLPAGTPVVAFGISYGAAIALRWAAEEPRVQSVMAITPYAELADAILRIRDDYARWMPRRWVRRAAQRIPELLDQSRDSLDPVHWIPRLEVPALLVAGERDVIAPPSVVQGLTRGNPAQCFYLEVPEATHEELPFHVRALAPALLAWLELPLADPAPAPSGPTDPPL